MENVRTACLCVCVCACASLTLVARLAAVTALLDFFYSTNGNKWNNNQVRASADFVDTGVGAR